MVWLYVDKCNVSVEDVYIGWFWSQRKRAQEVPDESELKLPHTTTRPSASSTSLCVLIIMY